VPDQVDLLEDALVGLDMLGHDQLSHQRQIHRKANPFRISRSFLGIDRPAKDEGGSVGRELLPDRQELIGCGVVASVLGVVGEGSQSFELGKFVLQRVRRGRCHRGCCRMSSRSPVGGLFGYFR